jgi:hypothetical protein
MPRSSHPPWFDHPNTIFEEYKLWRSPTMKFSLQPFFNPSLAGPSNLLSTNNKYNNNNTLITVLWHQQITADINISSTETR